MPKRLTVGAICELALRQIGALSINESAAPGQELDVAMTLLDQIVGHHTAVNRILHLVPTTIEIPLLVDKVDYEITNTADSDEPNSGIQFPLQASFRDANGSDIPVDIISRSEYEEITTKDQSGTPTVVYIDRLNKPTMRVHPVPGGTTPNAATGTSIQLVIQAFSKDLTAARGGRLAHEMRNTWQLWMIVELAYRIGSGPVRKIPKSELDDLRRDADRYLNDLLQNENREHVGYPRVVDFREF